MWRAKPTVADSRSSPLGASRLIGRGAHGSAAGVKALARLGQRELAGGAVQQRHAAVALQLAHLLAHGGGAHAQGAGGAAHRSVLHHGGQHGHAFEVVHGRFIVKLCFKE
jgi:hypothetical protein